MFSQIRRFLERQQATTSGPLAATISSHNTIYAAPKTTVAVQEAAGNVPKESTAYGRLGHVRKIDNLEKRFLVWTGKYKALADVPNTVSIDVIEKARNKVRIKLANVMVALTLIGCVGFALSGKAAAKRGETVKKMNLDWHKKANEEVTTEK